MSMWQTFSRPFGATMVYDFAATEKGELALATGEEVMIFAFRGGWYRGASLRSLNKRGIFPASYTSKQMVPGSSGEPVAVVPVRSPDKLRSEREAEVPSALGAGQPSLRSMRSLGSTDTIAEERSSDLSEKSQEPCMSEMEEAEHAEEMACARAHVNDELRQKIHRQGTRSPPSGGLSPSSGTTEESADARDSRSSIGTADAKKADKAIPRHTHRDRDSASASERPGLADLVFDGIPPPPPRVASTHSMSSQSHSMEGRSSMEKAPRKPPPPALLRDDLGFTVDIAHFNHAQAEKVYVEIQDQRRIWKNLLTPPPTAAEELVSTLSFRTTSSVNLRSRKSRRNRKNSAGKNLFKSLGFGNKSSPGRGSTVEPEPAGQDALEPLPFSNDIIQRWKFSLTEVVEPKGSIEVMAATSKYATRKVTTALTSHVDRMKRGAFTRAVRSGVPPELRPRLWWHCSGAPAKRARANAMRASRTPTSANDEGIVEASYATMQDWIRQGFLGAVAHDIEKDLARTFPTNANFEDEEGLASMRRVLLAYSIRNARVGYCQSMNFLCAILLLHFEDESYAFWLLAALVEDILPGDYYTANMVGSRTDNAVFQACLRWKLPKVYGRCEDLGVPLEPITCSWFLCLFVNTLPLQMVLRVWDILFHEGSKILFRIALAVLEAREEDVLQAEEFQGVYGILRRPASLSAEDDDGETPPLGVDSLDMLDVQSIIDMAHERKLNFSNATLNRMRAHERAPLQAEADRARARARARAPPARTAVQTPPLEAPKPGNGHRSTRSEASASLSGAALSAIPPPPITIPSTSQPDVVSPGDRPPLPGFAARSPNFRPPPPPPTVDSGRSPPHRPPAPPAEAQRRPNPVPRQPRTPMSSLPLPLRDGKRRESLMGVVSSERDIFGYYAPGGRVDRALSPTVRNKTPKPPAVAHARRESWSAIPPPPPRPPPPQPLPPDLQDVPPGQYVPRRLSTLRQSTSSEVSQVVRMRRIGRIESNSQSSET